MIFIPKTTPDCYVSSIVALNVISPKGTGDWHSAAALSPNAYPLEFYLYGENQPKSTHHLLGQQGIIDGTRRLHEMGYYPNHTPVWIADHPRACVDYLYYAILKTGQIGRVILNDWFPALSDKVEVYAILEKVESKLTPTERENLIKWQTKNPLSF